MFYDKTLAIGLSIVLLSPIAIYAQNRIYLEDFEDASVNYSTSVTEFSDGAADYFGRVSSNGISTRGVDYSGTGPALLANGYFAGEDMDAGNVSLPMQLNISGVNIANYINLELRVYLAEDDASDGNEDWDDPDYVHIDASIDGGTTQNLIWIEATGFAGTGSNAAPSIDTDFDGTGDGAAITNSFTQYTAPISGTGNTLSASITFNLGSGDEDIALDHIEIYGTPASSNSSNSDIVSSSSFTPQQNILYSNFSAASGLTSVNAVKVGEFTLRDGGSTGSDADAVGTILTTLEMDVSGNNNLAALALFDGPTNLAELTNPGNSITFSSINSGSGILAADDATKTFSLYATFGINVTDNQQVGFTITSATADGQNGSIFAALDAGGATTSLSADDNRIEVSATHLLFDQQPLQADTSRTLYPAPSVIVMDANGNTDLDYSGAISVTSSGTFKSSAITSYSPVNGEVTLDNISFAALGNNITLSINSGNLVSATSNAFDVLDMLSIARQDFDNTTPQWSYQSDVAFFDNGWDTDGYFGVLSMGSASPLSYPGLSGNLMAENDLDDEGDNGTSGEATISFENINISSFSDVTLSFHWQVLGYNSNSDNAKYQLYFDGLAQGEVFLIDGGVDSQDGKGRVWLQIPDGVNELSLDLILENNGQDGYSGFDDFELRGLYNGLVFRNSWSPQAPSASTSTSDALVARGQAQLSANAHLSGIQVLEGASLSVDSGFTLELSESIYNYGTFSLGNTASLLQTSVTDENAGSGDFTIFRRTDSIADISRYNYWASPLRNAQMQSVFTHTNPADWYTFDEGITDNWVAVPAPGKMLPGKGYITTPDTNASLNFTDVRAFSGDTINNGNLNLTIDADADDFVLVGNPYPSAIDNASFISDNPDLTGTLYFWNHSTQQTNPGQASGNNTSSDYASWNSTGAVAGNNPKIPDDHIQSLQGFFVQVKGLPSINPLTTITFENDQRVSGNNQQFFKQKAEERERLWLTLTNDSGAYNQILIGLTNQATDGWDQHYDGTKLKGNPFLAFYSMHYQEECIIQGLAKNLSQPKHLALGVDAWQKGRFTIALDSLNNWSPNNTIILIDSLTDKQVDLKTDDYQFTINQTGVIHHRFYLLIRAHSDVGLSDPIAKHPVDYYQKNESLVLEFNRSKALYSRAELTSMNGQVLIQCSIDSQPDRHAIDISTLPRGIYLLRLYGQPGQNHVFKVFLQ